MTSPSTQLSIGTRQPLADSIVALAETPDDLPGIDTHLRVLAQLAVDRVAALDYAAITALPDDGSSSVATSHDLIDDIEYTTPASPAAGEAAVTTMNWPRFRAAAADLGLHRVSVPLFTGSGTVTATLDLYGRDAAAMEVLALGIRAAEDPDLAWPPERDDLPSIDAGGEELITGFAEALSVRATVRLALEVIMRRTHADARETYLQLRLQAADSGISLLDAANNAITGP